MDLARAYGALSTCRSFGMGGMGPIPMTAVWQWQDRNDVVDPVLRRHTEDTFRAVDAAMLSRNRPSGGAVDNGS